jgi:hypothetical protein
MNTKVLIAFVGGLIVASGITYFAVRRSEPAAAPVAQVSQPDQTQPPADAVPPPQTTPPASTALTQAPKPSAAVPARPQPQREIPAPRTLPLPAGEQPKPAAPTPIESAKVTPPPPAPAEPAPAPKVEPPPPPKPHVVTIPAGTIVPVRIGETISSERSHAGDTFTATLDQPLVIDGFVIAERGARAQGRIVESERSGRVHGLAQLGIELTQLTTADGQHIRLNTAAFQKQGEASKKQDAAKVGIGAAIGAAIGAIAGGGKGAGVGAGVGGAAGAGDVLLTRGKAAEIPVETRISFRLSEPVTVTEHVK